MTTSPEPRATIIRARYALGWPPTQPDRPAEQAYELPLSAALTRSYRTDAHLMPYTSPRRLRLRKPALETTPVTFDAVLFDVDYPDVHGTPEPAPDSWRADLTAKLSALSAAHPDPYLYWTRGGARIVYLLPRPRTLTSPPDGDKWRRDYLVAIAYLERQFAIVADPACADWTRTYRAPHATRTAPTPEAWGAIGDPTQIGILTIRATPEDVDTACKRSLKTFRPAKQLDFRPIITDGQGLLYRALSARGSILGTRGTAYVIRCPRESHHTMGQTGDGRTLLYPPAAGHELGAIHCFHAHCSSLSPREWLREFTPCELDAARDAAGIRRSA